MKCLAIAAIAPLLLARPAAACDQPFDPGLMRLAEVWARCTSCAISAARRATRGAARWKSCLKRKSRRRAQGAIVASFNRGYRSFAGTYTTCTASATEAIARYMKEGESTDARNRDALRQLRIR